MMSAAFENAYNGITQQLKSETKETDIHFSSDNWTIIGQSSLKYKRLILNISCTPSNVNINYPDFLLYNLDMTIIRLFGMNATTLHLSGKRSQLSELFCELNGVPYLLNISGGKIGWKNDSMIYQAKFKKKELNRLKTVFDCLENNCKHIEKLIEVE